MRIHPMEDNTGFDISIEYQLLLILISAFLLAFGLGYLARVANDSRTIPRLVGYDCVGANGPLFANEEDAFPTQCGSIVAFDGELEG